MGGLLGGLLGRVHEARWVAHGVANRLEVGLDGLHGAVMVS